MPSISTRRQLLTISGSTFLSLLAGCTSSSDRSVEEASVDEPESIDSTHEFETTQYRLDSATAVIFRDADAMEAADPPDADMPGHPQRRESILVFDQEGANELQIDVDDGEVQRKIQSFVNSTEFERQSIIISQQMVDECFERNVVGVEAEDDSFSLNFCRQLKPPTVACEADKTVLDVILIRLDRPYDTRPSRRSASSGYSCPPDAGESTQNTTANNTTRREP